MHTVDGYFTFIQLVVIYVSIVKTGHVVSYFQNRHNNSIEILYRKNVFIAKNIKMRIITYDLYIKAYLIKIINSIM